LLVRRDGDPLIKVIIPNSVPTLRLIYLSTLRYISPFDDVQQFLLDAKSDSLKTDNFDKSIRVALNQKLANTNKTISYDIIEEIRQLPRPRKMFLMLVLLGSLPGTRPFAAIVKWFYRLRNE
jgi:hypothetical protein